ncbi:hypothetical protein [Rhodoplanes elegans]|uniref:hypothetical protein n=1 Tax=Rhodoplanes elegans TaxID=29408 RepID=UPI0011B943FC|nr:hypothetical protein [Rhodoplanes elegans]
MPIADPHPAVPSPPPDDQSIWRFMSLEKLLDLLLEQSLYFSQVKELQSQDPFEGHHSRGSIHLNLQFLNDPELLRSVVEQNWRGSKIPDLNNPEILGRIMGIFHPSTLELLANFSASHLT